MRYYVGLDAGHKLTRICVLNSTGAPAREITLPTDAKKIAAYLRPIRRSCVRVGIEACSIAEWLVPALNRGGFTPICIEGRHARGLLKANINKTDQNDARGIAGMMWMGVYRPVHIKSADSRRLRTLLTVRRQIQSKMIDVESCIYGLLRTFGIKPKRVSAKNFESHLAILLKKSREIAEFVKPLLLVRRAMRDQFDRLEKQLTAETKSDPVCRRLMTAPGVGIVVAATYRAAIDHPERFSKSRAVGAHIGLTPRTYQSGSSEVRGRISRYGDKWLRAALYSGAAAILHPQCHSHPLREWALQVAARRGRRKAIVALARRIAVILHRMWVDGTDYQADLLKAGAVLREDWAVLL